MRILIVSARFPDSRGKGDQQRSRQLVTLLSDRHDVTVMTAARASSPEASEALSKLATLLPLRVGPMERAAGAALAALAGVPIQVGWMTPPRAQRRIAAAASRVDVVIVVTIRCLGGPLPAPTVLDHVDALSSNMRQRAALEPRGPRRVAALLEARLLARHERRAARWVVAQTVVSPIDAAALPPHPAPIVLPLVVDLADDLDDDLADDLDDETRPEPEVRDIDVIMTGDMRYPPNRDGAEWLATEIVPALRALRPSRQFPRVVVAGRGADTLPHVAGVELMSDVPDIGALLRRSRVAAVTLRRGTGTPIKLHEAAANGAAPVATEWVAEAIGADVETAADPAGFAAAIGRLLDDESLRRERVRAVRESLRVSSSEAVAQQLTELLHSCQRHVKSERPPVRRRE